MNTIHVNASSAYDVTIGSGLLDRAGEYAASLVSGRSCVIVSGSNTSPLYVPKVRRSLESSGFRAETFVFPSGERSKNVNTLIELLNFAAEKELCRDDCLLALGGGVTGDITGLAAALYQRGIACIQLPTSLLAMVDSSVGGKTAVDLPAGKNLMGTFSQPKAVLCDTACLDTLPPERTAEGWAEIIKYGVLSGKDFTGYAAMGKVITECVAIKRDYVAADEFDKGQRRLLNFGHTVAHAIEKAGGYTLSHGKAVAVGMAMMTRGCCALGMCEPGTDKRLEAMLGRFALPTRSHIPAEVLAQAALSDKKRSGDTLTLIIPRAYGCCEAVEADRKLFSDILSAGM